MGHPRKHHFVYPKSCSKTESRTSFSLSTLAYIFTSKFCFGVQDCQSGPQAQSKWGHRPTPLLFWVRLNSLCAVYIAHVHNITKQLDVGLFTKKEVEKTNSIYCINLDPCRHVHCNCAYELVSKTIPTSSFAPHDAVNFRLFSNFGKCPPILHCIILYFDRACIST